MSMELAYIDNNHVNSESPLIKSPIFQQFLYMALPTIIGLVINGMYIVVNGLFISRGIGHQAMGAVSAVFPIQMFLLAISTMLGSGMASIISRHLGAKQQEEASRVFSASFLLAIGSAIIISSLFIIFRPAIYALLAVPSEFIPDANSYLMPVLIFSIVGFISNQITESFRASGNPKAMMQVLATGSILNIVFDALFIFVFKWGVAGAAWATTCAMSLALVMALQLQKKGENAAEFKLSYVFSKFKTYLDIVSFGMPVLLSHGGFSIIMAVSVYSISVVVPEQSSTLISAHGILMRCYMFLFLPIIGMMIALQTLSAFNYGARQYKRVQNAYISALICSTIWGLIVTVILCFNPEWLLNLFTKNQEIISEGINIAAICFLGFTASGVCMMSSGLFQGMGKALPAMLLDAARTYFLLIPLIFTLPMFFNSIGIWLSFPIADFIGGTIALTYSSVYLMKLRKQSLNR
ncbi:MATE family efflux transporter [Janthinobacterium sp. B9-8]|uniref:MATE family efflux transporter n=1 Tax=Janthinobacterium sp. B9-8 TaxID=1236179 RepID=UPI00061D3902|nr:MATE family efflux transporter [Janthinobacterium sp. B9-8]AMC36547.1 MATE family efflux transporter [Janthinobacterium sp. B9-8]